MRYQESAQVATGQRNAGDRQGAGWDDELKLALDSYDPSSVKRRTYFPTSS